MAIQAQYVDGLKGALRVTDPYQDIYGSDPTVMLSDWYHLPTNDMLAEYASPASGGDEPVPVSALINGVGCFPDPKVCHAISTRYLQCQERLSEIIHHLS